MTKKKLVLIGTNTDFGVSLGEFCADHPRIELLTQQLELEAGFEFVNEHCPDIVLVDIGLDIRPFDALLAEIRLRCDTTKFCWLTVFDEKIYDSHVETLGFDGVISRINFARNIDQLIDSLFPE